MDIQIKSVKFDADQKLLDHVEKKVNKLNQYFDRITDASVFLKLENSGQVKDKIVELRLNVPGDTLFVTEESKTFEAAMDEAVGGMRRQLMRYKERYRPRGDK